MENFELWSNHQECVDSHGNPKKRYFSEQEAICTMDYLEKVNNKKLRVYQCPNCGHYHLTKNVAAF